MKIERKEVNRFSLLCCFFHFLYSRVSTSDERKSSTHEYFIKATPHRWWLCIQIIIPFTPERRRRKDLPRTLSDPTDNMILMGNWYRSSNICIERFNSLKRNQKRIFLVWLLNRGLMCYQKKEMCKVGTHITFSLVCSLKWQSMFTFQIT